MAMILNLSFGCGSVLEGMFIILVNKRELKGGVDASRIVNIK